MAANRTTNPKQRRTGFIAAALLTMALVASACGSGGESADKNGNSGPNSDAPEVDAANCPVAALDKATDPVEINVWHAYSALTKQAIDDAAASYNQSQNKVKVNVEAQGTYEELLKKYESRLGDPSSLPDAIFSEDTTMRFMIDSGSVIATGDCIAADPEASSYYDALLPQVRNTYSIKDVLWPAAFGVSMPIMYLNNDHLKQAGMSADDVPQTLADVRKVAEKLKAANIAGVEAPVAIELYGWFPENWLTGSGQEIVNESNGHDGLATKSTIDNKTTREVLTWLQDMQKDGLLKAFPRRPGQIDQFLSLGKQTSSILIEGSRAITTVNSIVQNSYKGESIEGAEGIDTEQLKGLDVSVYPIPGLKEAGQASPAGSAAYIVNGDSPERIAASWDFMKYFNSDPVQVQWTLMGSYLPSTTTIQKDPKITDYFANDLAGRWLSVVNEQLTSSNPDFPNPIIGPYDQFRSGFQSAMERIVIQGDDMDSTLRSFDTDFQSALDTYASEVGG